MLYIQTIFFILEKSYFVDESYKQLNINKIDHKCLIEVDILYNGLVKCLQDYQGEVKHSKVIIKEVYEEIKLVKYYLISLSIIMFFFNLDSKFME